jgi:hypothetical protein
LIGVLAVQDALGLYERLWQHNGGHPQQGRQQRTLLQAAGFRCLQTSTGTNTFPPALGAEFFGGMLTRPPLAETAITLGWADRPLLERYAAALHDWAKHPDALWATIMVETVGWAE